MELPNCILQIFLHMTATMTESGSTEEQIEFFVLNSQNSLSENLTSPFQWRIMQHYSFTNLTSLYISRIQKQRRQQTDIPSLRYTSYNRKEHKNVY